MRFGIVGVGAMGRPISENIINAGFDLVICDTHSAATNSFLCMV